MQFNKIKMKAQFLESEFEQSNGPCRHKMAPSTFENTSST